MTSTSFSSKGLTSYPGKEKKLGKKRTGIWSRGVLGCSEFPKLVSVENARACLHPTGLMPLNGGLISGLQPLLTLAEHPSTNCGTRSPDTQKQSSESVAHESTLLETLPLHMSGQKGKPPQNSPWLSICSRTNNCSQLKMGYGTFPKPCAARPPREICFDSAPCGISGNPHAYRHLLEVPLTKIPTQNLPALFSCIFWKTDRYSMVNSNPILVEGRHDTLKKKTGIWRRGKYTHHATSVLYNKQRKLHLPHTHEPSVIILSLPSPLLGKHLPCILRPRSYHC